MTKVCRCVGGTYCHSSSIGRQRCLLCYRHLWAGFRVLWAVVRCWLDGWHETEWEMLCQLFTPHLRHTLSANAHCLTHARRNTHQTIPIPRPQTWGGTWNVWGGPFILNTLQIDFPLLHMFDATVFYLAERSRWIAPFATTAVKYYHRQHLQYIYIDAILSRSTPQPYRICQSEAIWDISVDISPFPDEWFHQYYQFMVLLFPSPEGHH